MTIDRRFASRCWVPVVAVAPLLLASASLGAGQSETRPPLTAGGAARPGPDGTVADAGLVLTESDRLDPSPGECPGEAGDRMGVAVALDGDRAVVGAPVGDLAAQGGGVVYAFERDAGSWRLRQRLTAPQASPDTGFGTSVALDGDILVVGEPGGVGGSVHVFVWSGESWVHRQEISDQPIGAGPATGFGTAVAVSDDTIAVGGDGVAAVFVLSGESWTEQARFVGPGRNADFGVALAVDGDTLLVGAPGDDPSGPLSGAAYVFVRVGDTWLQQQRLVAAAGAADERFGSSVDLEGDTSLVGARGVEGERGAAFLYERTAGVWSERQRLEGSDREREDFFGWSVALRDELALIGAPSVVQDRESAYVFERSGLTWREQQRLTRITSPSFSEWLGTSVAIGDDTALVGAPSDAVCGRDSGSVEVFELAGSEWRSEGRLRGTPDVALDRFGRSLAVAHATAVVGAYDHPGNQRLVYVFERSLQGWRLIQDLRPAGVGPGEGYGASVATSGNTIAVGAAAADGRVERTGAVFVFTRHGSGWVLTDRVTAPDGRREDGFGSAVAITGDTLVVGAPGHENPFQNIGAGYVFVRVRGRWRLQQKLSPEAGAFDGRLGSAVAVEGDVAVLGAPHDSLGRDRHAGSANVFVRSAGFWSEAARLISPRRAPLLQFGEVVTVSGGTVMVGESPQRSGQTDFGAVYVYRSDAGAWFLDQTLESATPEDGFGASLAVAGELLVVGAPFDDADAANSGAAYTFTGGGGSWSIGERLARDAPQSSATFGWSVGVSGGSVLVGTPGANQPDHLSGSVSVFEPDPALVRRYGARNGP